MTINYCPECGSKLSDGISFCGECGSRIDSPEIVEIVQNTGKHCPTCSYTTLENETFCPECGIKLVGIAQTTRPTVKGPNKKQKPHKITRKNTKQKPFTINKIQNKHKSGFFSKLAKAAIVLLIVGTGAKYYFDTNKPDTSDNSASSNQSAEEYSDENKTNIQSNIPIPILKEVIARKTLSENDLTITSNDGSISMTASPTCLDGETKATIQRVEVKLPDPNITLRGYDFKIGDGGEMNGVVKIQIPYSQDDIPIGYTAEQSISALVYNEVERIYEPVHYVIDKSNKKLIISTTHLSSNFFVSVNPADYHNNPYIYMGSLKALKQPNWGVFYTTSINNLNETAYKYDFNLAKNAFKNSQLSSLAITEKVKDYGLNTPAIMFINEGLSLLGSFAAYPENTGKVIKLLGRENNFNTIVKSIGIKGAKLSSLTSVLGHAGMVLAIGQLGSDLYEGKDHAAFKLIKNLVYWQGDALAEYGAKLIFGFSGVGTYVNIGLVSLFVTEQIAGPIETWNDVQFTEMPEHKKLFSAYTKFYKQGRNEKKWLQTIDKLNEKAMNSQERPKSMQKGEYFEKLLKAELTDYTDYFWNKLTPEQRAEYVINSPEGYYYGHYALIHYAGNKTDKKKYVSAYIDEIAAGKYPSMKLSWDERYLVNTNSSVTSTISFSDNLKMAQMYLKNLDKRVKGAYSRYMFNYIMEYKIQPVMVAQKELIMLKSERELHKALVNTQSELNKLITLKIIDKSNTNNKAKYYANHIVMPVSDKLLKTGILPKWKVVLDQEGNGNLSFTMLAYLKNGGFTQLGIYPPKTKDFSKQKPIMLVGFNLQNNHIIVNLKDVPKTPEEAIKLYAHSGILFELNPIPDSMTIVDNLEKLTNYEADVTGSGDTIYYTVNVNNPNYKYTWSVNKPGFNIKEKDGWKNNFRLNTYTEDIPESWYIGIGETTVSVKVYDTKGIFIGEDSWTVTVKPREDKYLYSPVMVCMDYLEGSIELDGEIFEVESLEDCIRVVKMVNKKISEEK